MITVYASVLDVMPQPPETPAACFDRLVAISMAWVEEGYLRKWGISVKLSMDGATVIPAPDHSVRCSVEKANLCVLVTIEWRHPGDPGSDLYWNTVVQLAQCDDVIQVAMAVRLSSFSSFVKPLTFQIGRPRLFDKFLDSAHCFIGKQPIPKGYRSISAPDVVKFVENTLLSMERPLPVVVVSPDAWTDCPTIDVQELHKSLLGFAQVVALRDKWAAFKLTDCIGKELSCFNGAVRLYWPRLSAKSNPFDHPLYMPESIRWHAQNGQPLDRFIFRLLVAISAFRFSEAPVVRQAFSAIEKLKHQHLQNLLSKEKKQDSEIAEIGSALERAWDENFQLKQEIDQVKEQASELSSQLESQKAAWALVQQTNGRPQTTPTPATQESRDPDFQTVAEVVTWAKRSFTGSLLFLESATESAVNSPFLHPERVLQLFQALDELVRHWKEKGTLGESWKLALKKKGFDYKDRISATSQGKYRTDYEFTYECKRRIFEDHVTIGAKQADSCLSVHWFRDDKKKILVIGSCGRHGTNTSS